MIIHLYSIAESRLCAIEQFRKSSIADNHVEMEKQRMGSVCLQYVMLNAFMVTYRLGIWYGK